jgi:acetyl-CoA acetyltransferase
MSEGLRDRAALVGVGHTNCAKDLGVSPLQFTVDTCLEAIADAGLQVADIDGIAGLPGPGPAPGPLEVMQALGLPGLDFYGGQLGGGVGPGTVANAALAVAGGVCDAALAYVTMTAPRPGSGTYNYMAGDPTHAEGDHAFTAPYGLGVFMQYFAPFYQRRRALDGVTDEQMGAYVVAMRDNASRNPHAALGRPITLEDYLDSRWVCHPLRLFDCDMPVDVCGAVVVTSAERARDLRHAPVYVSAVTTGTGPRPDMIFWHDYDDMAFSWSAHKLWRNAGLGTADMDFAMLYDGFAPLVLYGLEAYGFVGKGEAGAFLGAGQHLRTGGLPLNPHGGNNSEGRSWAIGHMVEAVLQLQGRAGARQLPDVHAAMANGGAVTLSGALVLHN